MKPYKAKFPELLVTVALGALLTIPLPSGSARAEGSDATVSLSKLDITHGVVGYEPIDQFDMITNFDNKEASENHRCDSSSDSPILGFVVTLQEGACGTAGAPAGLTIPKLTKISPNKYRFEGVTREGVTVDATLTKLLTPAGSCGKWNLVLDATPINLAAIQTNPVATAITLQDGSQGCLAATAAIDQ
jgi:hypothetical protein